MGTSICVSRLTVDPDLAREVASSFLDGPSNRRDTTVRAAYEQLERESDEIFAYLTSDHPGRRGIQVRFTRCRMPYDSDEEMVAAVRTHGVLEVTAAATERDRSHPLLSCEFGDAYDRLRAVHDIVGHVYPRFGFDRDGEFSAWLTQERRYSGLARWALATELHAEHSVRWTTGALSEHKAFLLDRALLTRVRHSWTADRHRSRTGRTMHCLQSAI